MAWMRIWVRSRYRNPAIDRGVLIAGAFLCWRPRAHDRIAVSARAYGWEDGTEERRV